MGIKMIEEAIPSVKPKLIAPPQIIRSSKIKELRGGNYQDLQNVWKWHLSFQSSLKGQKLCKNAKNTPSSLKKRLEGPLLGKKFFIPHQQRTDGRTIWNKLLGALGDHLSHNGILQRWFTKDTPNHSRSLTRKGQMPVVINGKTLRVPTVGKKPKGNS